VNPKRYLSRYWTDPRVEIRASPIEGNGLFARELIKEGEIVEVMGGAVLTQAEFETFSRTTATQYNAIQIAEGLHLVEHPEVTETRRGSLNHSCDPNLWMTDEVTFVARRDITACEELTVDYALFTAQPGWAMDCRCGSRLCRQRVTGNDWKLAGLGNRYRGHFSPFINDRIGNAGESAEI
jgi:SET domain-containing protein